MRNRAERGQERLVKGSQETTTGKRKIQNQIHTPSVLSTWGVWGSLVASFPLNFKGKVTQKTITPNLNNQLSVMYRYPKKGIYLCYSNTLENR